MKNALKPFFCFYGGKWRAAPKYPAPLFDTVIEPFAGAAGYATRHFNKRVILIEKDPVIASLWRYLVKVSPEEIRALPLEVTTTADDLNVCPEARSLIGFWLNKGSATPKRRPSKWMREGTHSASFWGATIRERIATQVEAVRHWNVIEGSYESAPDVNATWFIDPPYQRQGQYYRCSATEIDFDALGAWCQGRRGRVLVCEQAGATWLPFQPFAVIKANESRHGKKRCSEVLWQGGTRAPAAGDSSSSPIPVTLAESSTGTTR
jgi:hypothetical protein